MKTVTSARLMFFAISFCLLVFGRDVALAQTTNTCVSPLNSDFFTKYEVVEIVEYAETNSAGPVLNGSNAFVFDAIIRLSTNLYGTASSAVLSLPGEGPSLMKKSGTSGFSVAAVTNAFTNITSAFPDGTYEFTIFSNTIPVTLPEGADLPNAPTLSNYAAAQKINPAEDFTLNWTPFIAGGVLDAISVTVDDTNGGTLFKSGDFGCPGLLDGTATSIVIPANTLASNATYQTQIVFVKVYTFDTNSIPNVALLAGTEAETITTISSGTTLIATSAPILTNAAWLPGGSVRFDFTTTPGLMYTVQFNQDLSNSNGWSPLLSTNAVANIVPFTNSPRAGVRAGYYRVLQQ